MPQIIHVSFTASCGLVGACQKGSKGQRSSKQQTIDEIRLNKVRFCKKLDVVTKFKSLLRFYMLVLVSDISKGRCVKKEAGFPTWLDVTCEIIAVVVDLM